MIEQMGRQAKKAQQALALCTAKEKRLALLAMAEALLEGEAEILVANQKDLDAAKDLSAAMIDRLRLTLERIKAMSDGVKAIAELADPVGRTLAQWDRPNGLKITRMAVPIGVIAVIYESRPNVTADAAALCLKSGNAVVLRGGSDSFYSSSAIFNILAKALKAAAMPAHCVQMLDSPDRAAVNELIQLDQYIDVLIPRGGKGLVNYLTEHSKVPLLKHLDGLCHTYVHQDADVEMAVAVCCNAKMRRTGICGATETILMDEAISERVLPKLVSVLSELGCEIVGNDKAGALSSKIGIATEEDWATEYLDAKVSIRVVDDFKQAIEHIHQYSSQHTDAIITENTEVAQDFFLQVDSAIVMHNAATQFADGGEFGMGAEIGIATGKLHARGPVGVEQLTTFKYIVEGTGQVRPA